MSQSLTNLKPIKDKLLTTKGPIFVLFGQQATVDHVASALSLYLVLKNQEKDVSISSPSQLRAEFSRLIGLNEITQTIGNKNLVISFGNYDFNAIEKISHNDGVGGQFELIIQPKSSQKAPDPKQIEFSFRGAQAEIIFLIGISRLEDLGPIYETERQLFNQTTLVAINRRQTPNYSAISIADSEASSFSEIVYDLLKQLNYKIKGDIASNLLAGLDHATNRFQNPQISGNVFITAGELINHGAKRQPPRPSATGFNPESMLGQPPFLPFIKPQNTLPTQSNQPVIASVPPKSDLQDSPPPINMPSGTRI